jgi:hypothetical protein
MSFPTKEAFNEEIKKEEEENRVFSWAKLEEGSIYQIHASRVGRGKFGSGFILTLAKEDAIKINVWATPQAARRLNLDIDGEFKKNRYIRPLGLKACKTDSTRNYHAFDLMGAC